MMPKGVYLRTTRPVIDRVLDRCIPIPEAGCWLFEGCLTPSGYGQVRVAGRGHLAHRITYACLVDPIPDGAHVLHRCDTPSCVNPDHLFLGNASVNAADCMAKGRKPKAEAHKSSKLTEAQVRSILLSREKGRALARHYGVSEALISGVRQRKLWAHVTVSADAEKQAAG